MEAEAEAPRPRWVFVLGPDPILDVDAAARRAKSEGAELVLLSVGYPVTTAQGAVVERAVRLAAELGVWLDAVLVTTPQKVLDFIDEADHVRIVASGLQRRRLLSILDGRVERGEADALSAQLGQSHGRRRPTPFGSDD